MNSRSLSSSVLLICAAAACSVPSGTTPGAGAQKSVSVAEAPNPRGEELYLQHCSVCHGSRGHGDGPAAPHLLPPARRFESGGFRLVSSENGAPSDADLVATLRRGIPGSAMPAWSWLPDSDLESLAAHVRTLAIEGSSQELATEARRAGESLSSEQAQRLARERMTPDRTIEAAASVPADATHLAAGRRVYLERCAQCHASDGTGARTPRPNADGGLNWARDFTAGFLKGGDSTLALTRRIRAGLPGSAMPPNRLDPADEAALVVYVQSLIPKGVADRLVHARSTLTARRVAVAPEDPDDPSWKTANTIRVVLAPLWWNEEAVLEASLSALHDGETVALRLSWADATGDVRLFAESRASDGAALQLSSAKEPALFGMGAPHEPTNLWHWQALRVEDVEGALDLVAPVPHAREPDRANEVRADVPLYHRLLGRLEPSERADQITVRGVETLPGANAVPGEVRAKAHWQDGRWSLVFRRALQGPNAESKGDMVALVPGSPVQVACAVWNGAAGDAGARKSISIWQELLLER
ncbi:MAG: ethylbenzene dehydrogenase-related protein [Planctomycetota bacterium]|nr:ethylbenzene dehydrogenase-related protein [Planctomycetota bacterium]